MTVEKNVEFGLSLQGAKASERRQKAAYFLDVVGLSRFSQALPRELSGGMKQRAAIARALACEPKVLLMDEPFGALDMQNKQSMQEFLLDLWRRTRTTILMITHDVEEAVFLAQRIYVLKASPGEVKATLDIDLPAERNYTLRHEAAFLRYKREVSDLLRTDAS
jgi:NitT/TauT family transport system ATP-binding protein